MVNYNYTAATTVQFRALQPTGDAAKLRMMMSATHQHVQIGTLGPRRKFKFWHFGRHIATVQT